ncbi:hypothetical protein HNO89_002803 [Sporosarcina luteola]|nr:hypothetical protein [Sporosarcina luteola]
MKRKWIISSAVLSGIACILLFLIINKVHYPSPPIDSITPKEIVNKLNESNQQLVEISKDSSGTWYVINNLKEVNKIVEDFISEKGWSLSKIEGNSLFFERQGELLVASTEMWTNKYRLVKVPANFESD